MHGAAEQPRPKIQDDAPEVVEKPIAFKTPLEYKLGKVWTQVCLVSTTHLSLKTFDRFNRDIEYLEYTIYFYKKVKK